jgi:hypothetical protein
MSFLAYPVTLKRCGDEYKITDKVLPLGGGQGVVFILYLSALTPGSPFTGRSAVVQTLENPFHNYTLTADGVQLSPVTRGEDFGEGESRKNILALIESIYYFYLISAGFI